MIDKCSICGKDAGWNTPYVDVRLNLYCNACADKTDGVMLFGVEQHQDRTGYYKVDAGHLHYMKNHVVLTADTDYTGVKGRLMIHLPQYSFMCWINNGGTAYHLTDDEKAIATKDPEALLDKIYRMVQAGYVRCTGCNVDIPIEQVAGRPLFAGINCAACWETHKRGLEAQSKAGHVCSMCHQPWGNCCC